MPFRRSLWANSAAARAHATPSGLSAGLGSVFVLTLLSSVVAHAQGVPRSAILITIDTLRPDRLGCYGNRSVPTPSADRLARDGVLFRRAITSVPLTLP